MQISRRQFLRDSGLAAAYMALPAWLTACAHGGAAPAAQQLSQAQPGGAAQPSAHPELAHLLSRITYGPRPGDIERAAQLGWDAFLEQQLSPEQIDDSQMDARLSSFSTLTMSNAELISRYPRKGGAQAGPRTIIQELEAASLLRAIFSQRQLFEIMVDFWSNHFNIYIGQKHIQWLKTSDDRDVIRQHALGKFRDLLLASAKSPAMLVYLDNASNIRPGARRGNNSGGLNENYAREVMELHTVGADGGYSQDEIPIVARALTGWTVAGPGTDQPGEFRFALRLHDDEAKRIPFLKLDLPAGGGIKDGETLLATLASHPNTAQRIAAKLCVAFVSDDPPPALVARAAQAFLDSDTDIRATLKLILQSDEFKASAGQKIKQPLRALVSQMRALGADIPSRETSAALPLLLHLRSLGQPFFGWQPPNGYPQEGAAWANTGGMLGRWNLAFALAEGRVKGVTSNLNTLLPSDSPSAGALVDALGAALLPGQLADTERALLADYVSDGGNTQATLAHTALNRKLPELVGLLLASPMFQTH